MPEQLASLGQPAAQRAFGAPQMIGGLVAGHPLEIAEDDRQAKPLGEPLDLLVQDRPESSGVPALGAPARPRGLLDLAAAGGVGPGLECRPIRHPVQPGTQRVAARGSTRLAEQQHERGLERVRRRRSGPSVRPGRCSAPATRAAPPARRTPPRRRRVTNRSSSRASDKPVHVRSRRGVGSAPAFPDRNAVLIVRRLPGPCRSPTIEGRRGRGGKRILESVEKRPDAPPRRSSRPAAVHPRSRRLGGDRLGLDPEHLARSGFDLVRR